MSHVTRRYVLTTLVAIPFATATVKPNQFEIIRECRRLSADPFYKRLLKSASMVQTEDGWKENWCFRRFLIDGQINHLVYGRWKSNGNGGYGTAWLNPYCDSTSEEDPGEFVINQLVSDITEDEHNLVIKLRPNEIPIFYDMQNFECRLSNARVQFQDYADRYDVAMRWAAKDFRLPKPAPYKFLIATRSAR